ncbi:MAG: autotransporter domain-containing protein [Endomicrobia bacterium]|nr:autotransporter domain-containing protein [Endomicrobiia bacterium]
MKIKQCVWLAVLAVFCLSGNLFAAELKIETGKEEVGYFKGDSRQIYDDTIVYDNVTIGAGTTFHLYSDPQYVVVSSQIVNVFDSSGTFITSYMEYTMRRDEIISTLALSSTGTLTLNAGSELGIRNQYSLVTRAQDVSLETYHAATDSITGEKYYRILEGYFSNRLDRKVTASSDRTHENRRLWDLRLAYGTLQQDYFAPTANLFTGDIVFEAGDAATTLTFLAATNPMNPTYGLPSSDGSTDEFVDVTSGDINNDVARMSNDFIIHSNNAVFNIIGKRESVISQYNSRVVFFSGNFSGDGTIVKTGGADMFLFDTYFGGADATLLTGNNTGFAWRIEEGAIAASAQMQLGYGNIFIDDDATLALAGGSTALGTTNIFANDMTFNNGGITSSGGSFIELSGNLSTGDFGNANFVLGYNTGAGLLLSGSNDAKIFNINYFARDNFLKTDVDGLATDYIIAKGNAAPDGRDPAFYDFTLIIDENSDKEYSGSLQGDMYLKKLGSGLLTLSGENSYDKGTYITEGGIAITNAYSLGTPDGDDPNKGKIMFDSSSTVNFASLQVIESVSGDIELYNNIHINKGAVFNVYDNQKLTLYGDIVRYDARPGYEAAFIKDGLGTLAIGNSSDSARNINITTFTVNAGGFMLAENVTLKSSFEVNDSASYLEIAKDSKVYGTININEGDLKIYNEANISSAAVNFLNTSATDLSSFYIASESVMSSDTMSNTIKISSGINFVNNATVTMYSDVVDFLSAAPVVHKSGGGNLIYQSTGPAFKNFEELAVYDGRLTLRNFNLNASNIVIDGGILHISSGSYLTSAQSEITVYNGGIGIYDGNSIDNAIKLNFLGTDTVNLATLVVEADNAVLGNNIFVKTGVIVENSNNLTITANSIDFDSAANGIFAKSGAGTMTIAQTGGGAGFSMKELRVLEGLLNATTGINVTNLTLSGSDLTNLAMMTITSSTVTTDSAAVYNAILTVGPTSTLNAASGIRANNGGIIQGSGRINGAVTLNNGSFLRIGNSTDISVSSQSTYGSLSVDSVNFNPGSTYCVGIKSEAGLKENDKLLVSNNVSINDNVTLQVNVSGTDYDEKKSFEIIQYGGSLIYSPENIAVFNINLGSARFMSSINTSNAGSILLDIWEGWRDFYIPNATKNQQAMIDALNKLNTIVGESSKFRTEVINLADNAYSEYNGTGNSAPFFALTQSLSGITYANSFAASALSSKANIIYSNLSSGRNYSRNNIWAQAYVNTVKISENEDNPEFENIISGIVAGYDMLSSEADDLIFGIAGFYGMGEFKQLSDTSDVTDMGFNAYASYDYQQFTVRGLAGLTFQGYKSARKLTGTDAKIDTDYTVNVVNIDVEGAYNHNLGESLVFKPLIGINCAIVSNDDFQEEGSSQQRLRIESGSFTKAEIKAGVGLESKSESRFNWRLNLLVKQIVSGDTNAMTAYFAEYPDVKFEIESTALAKTLFSGNAGCQYEINNNMNLFVDLSADTSSNLTAVMGNLGLSYKW